jgi:uncharacterized damage-inducible protein DinB
MRHAFAIALFAAGITPAALSAQADARLGVSAVEASWSMVTGHFTRAAEQLPESLYAFKPTPEVRSFGELIGHVAGAQNMFCASALGEAARAEDEIEKTVTSKAALVAALAKSTEYCTRAYALPDTALAARTKLFGQEMSRLQALSLNAVHNGEHYGNIVTYLRINGMVPPSSQQQP